jgi:hypothetical protein
MKTTLVTMVDMHEWDKLIKDTYGRPYCFQQQEGCKPRGIFTISVPEEADDYENDTVPEIVNHDDRGVSFKAWLERDPKQALTKDDASYTLDLWWERNFYPDIQMIANDLHGKGLLEAKQYVIDIDW